MSTMHLLVDGRLRDDACYRFKELLLHEAVVSAALVQRSPRTREGGKALVTSRIVSASSVSTTATTAVSPSLGEVEQTKSTKRSRATHPPCRAPILILNSK